MSENQKPYFEINGKPIKRNFFRKYRSYLAVYSDYIEIEMEGNHDIIQLDDIDDIFIKDPIIEDIDCRTVLIDYFEDGQRMQYTLEESTYEGVAEEMAEVLATKWTHFVEKYSYPATVKWFIACTLTIQISSELNPNIFGGQYKYPDVIKSQREGLAESWGFKSREDLLEMLPKLYEGRAMNQYLQKLENINTLDSDNKELINTIRNTCGDKGIWAWDLQRLILISGLGYVSDYISYEEALDWCLKAALKLQSIYSSWDDFMQGYLWGYCFWSGDDMDDEDSEAYQRRQIYEFYKNKKGFPFTVSWNHPLTCEW